jgi:DNA-binding NarL/FixJ family response regulator
LASRPDRDLQARAAAALQVLREDPGVDRLELLALVVWPTAKLEQVRARPWTDAQRERVFELSAQGLNQYEIARELGRPRSTVAQILRDGRAAFERRRAA